MKRVRIQLLPLVESNKSIEKLENKYLLEVNRMDNIYVGIIGAGAGAIITFCLNWLHEKSKNNNLRNREQKEKLLKNIYTPLINIFERESLVDDSHEEKLIQYAMDELQKRRLPCLIKWRKRKRLHIAKIEIAPKLLKSGLSLHGKVICHPSLYTKVINIIELNLDICDEPLKKSYIKFVRSVDLAELMPQVTIELGKSSSFKEQVPEDKRESIIKEMSEDARNVFSKEANANLYSIYTRTKEMYSSLRRELKISK